MPPDTNLDDELMSMLIILRARVFCFKVSTTSWLGFWMSEPRVDLAKVFW